MQVTPEQAMSNSAKWYALFFGQPPEWLVSFNPPYWLPPLLIAIGVGIFLSDYITGAYKKLEYISLKDAAKKACAKVDPNHVASSVITNFSGRPRIRHYANKLIKTVPVYGNIGSDKCQLISNITHFRIRKDDEDMNSLTYIDEDVARWRELKVKRSDLRRAITKMKHLNTPDNKPDSA